MMRYLLFFHFFQIHNHLVSMVAVVLCAVHVVLTKTGVAHVLVAFLFLKRCGSETNITALLKFAYSQHLIGLYRL